MNDKQIWDTLFKYIGNPYGVAGLMGNLYAESRLNPKNLQGSYEKKLGYTDDSYTSAVDNGKYSAYHFIHDGAGYGLAQWTYWSRKENLLKYAADKGTSVGDSAMQLEFLWKELQTYSGVVSILASAKSVREASDVVLTKYERPSDQSESVKQKRTAYGQTYYDRYANGGVIIIYKENKGGVSMATNYDKYINSTGTHYISNSGSDERGAYTGGKAGDQNSKEWCLKAWYSRPWNYVLRYPDQAVALKIAQMGIDAALNDKVGYDQGQRNTYWTQLKAVKYEPSKITVACEEDCTAGVSSNVRGAGFLFGIKALQEIPICSSRNMRSEFKKAGFKVLTADKYLTSGKYLLPGDILLCENHHAATNVTLGSLAKNEWNPGSASIQPEGIEPYVPEVTIKLPSVRITGSSVNVRKGPGTEYGSVGLAKMNDYLYYFGYTYSNGWLLVEYGGQTAWVSGKYGEIVG